MVRTYLPIICLALAALPSAAFARFDVEAIPGEPFGVARITIPVSAFRGQPDLDRISVVEKRGRALYPAVTRGAVGKLLGDLLGGAGIGIGEGQIGNVFVSFVFTGEDPLEVTLRLPDEVRLTIVPRDPRRAPKKDLHDSWWKDYTAHLQRVSEDGDFPPLVQTYLSSMLASRMKLKAPALSQLGGTDSSATTETAKSIEMLMGLERMHFGVMKETMQGKVDRRQAANLPLPPAWEQLPLALKELEEVPVEPLAMHVPQECLYIRFGSFTNSLWMDSLSDEYGDLANMVLLRAYQKKIDARTQKQTAMERDPLGDLFAHTIIEDVAMIGLDPFAEDEGGSVGFLLQAKNNFILGNNMRNMQQKRLTAEKDNGATLDVLKIAGRDVRFASTPDNHLHSYYANDGDYHLMTNSRRLVERFFEAGEGKGSLGGSAEFRHARQVLPLARQDNIFVYLSTAFFQNLMSPHFQVELRRRMQAVVDIELVQLGRLAAKREGKPAETIEDLIAADLLPGGFGKRPDGSGPIIAGEKVIDSLRGPRGYFLPVPDVKIEGITAEEERRVNAQLETLARDWKRMDPLMVGAKRTALEGQKGVERIVVDAHISPLDELKYGWVLSLLGPPTDVMIQPAPDDAISVQATVKGGALLPSIAAHQLMVGVKDAAPPHQPGGDSGLLSILQTLRNTPGYLGGWPKPGYLDLLPFLGGGATDASGFSRMLLGLWRWQGSGFSLLSFDRGVLEASAPHVRPVRAEVPAQIRIHAGNLSAMKIAKWVDDLSYDRALAGSQGNVRLMQLLHEQLGVPLGECKGVAERLLDGDLVCPLGGEYGISDDRGGRWVSTAWPQPGVAPPEFHSPIHKWFRGADAYVTRNETGLFAHVELDMYRAPGGLPKIDLPLFNLFGGGQKAVKPAENLKAPPPDGVKVEVPANPFEEPADKANTKKPASPAEDLPPPPASGTKKPAKKEF